MSKINQKSKIDNYFDSFFTLLLLFVCFVLFGIACYLRQIKNDKSEKTVTYSDKIKAEFIIEKRSVPTVKKVIKPEKKETVKEEKKIVDLSEKPVLAQKTDITEEQKPARSKPVRRVYGLKKVYSKGLGEGGTLSDAVIGKIGNTINTEVDTFIATEHELKGVLASTTTVTQAPRFKKTAKPEYTKEMIENKLEGVVKLKVLVDIDGKIKKAKVLKDIGLSSAHQALEATKEMLFIPAMRGSEAVAVWIIIPIRFVIMS